MSDTFDENSNDDTDALNPLDVLADEFSQAIRSGSYPSISDFENRLPERREEVRALLTSIQVFERVSQQEHSRHRQHRKTIQFSSQKLQTVGDFRMVREIGRGGMGIIYEAEQMSLKRRVALKVLGPGIADSPNQLDRFHRESEAIARLHHTNIVPVYGIGEDNGVHFYAMHLIEGVTLNDAPKLSFAEIAKIGYQVADALQYAHSHGVLHRDVKPSNLIRDEKGNTWVTDFGLAKLAETGNLTQAGDIVGTLRYMAPEQLEGIANEQSDIYGLGLTLYELVTGIPAFDDSQTFTKRLRDHRIQPPRSINADIPLDLETIILKATTREPRGRYPTAGSMAEDLLRFIEDRPIAARRASSTERLVRWCRRNPALAFSSSLAALLLIAAAGISAFGYVTTSSALAQANQEKVRAKLAKSTAEAARERAETTLAVAIEAFDSIFDNIGNRGEPQSIDLEWDESNVLRFQASLTDADADLLRSLLTFYGQFALQNETDFDLIAKTAAAHHRIAQIHQRLGHIDESSVSFDTALKVYRELYAKFPTKQEYAIAIAKILNDKGVLLGNNAEPPFEVSRQHELAIDFLKSLPEEWKQSRSIRLELAKSLDLAGSVMPRRGMPNLGLPPPMAPGSQAGMPPGIPPRDGRRMQPSDRGPQFGLGRAPKHGKQQDTRHWPEKPPGLPPDKREGSPDIFAMIESHLDESCEILEKLNVEEPENVESRLLLAQAERHRYVHFSVSRNSKKAVVSFQRAMKLLEDLIEDHPTTPKFLLELADTLATAGVPSEFVTPEEAEDNLKRSMTYCFQLIKRLPNAPEYQALLASCYSNLARSESRREEWSSAKTNFQLAFDRLDALKNRFPSNDFYKINRMVALGELSWAMRVTSEANASQKEWNAMVLLMENAVTEAQKETRTTDPFHHLAIEKLLKELASIHQLRANDAKAQVVGEPISP